MSAAMYNAYSKDIDNEVLIQEVKVRPALYNRHLKEYCDIPFKKAMWEEIHAILFADTWHKISEEQREIRGTEVIKRWNNLRTSFSRELKIMRDPLTQKRRKYIYFNKLMFLLEDTSTATHFVEAHESEQNFAFSKSSSVDKFEDESTPLPDKSPPADTETENVKTNQWKRREYRKRDVEKYVQYSINKLKEELAFKNRVEEAQTESVPKTFDTDADTNFALSLVPSLKMVPLNKKIDAQIEVLNVLKKYTSTDNFSFEYSIVKYEKNEPSEADDESEIMSIFESDK